MRPSYVDFHAHLDLYPDLVAAVRDCNLSRTATLAVTTTPQAFERNCEVAAESEYVRAALGLHPQLVAERAGELDMLERLLARTRYVGEVGLDAGPRHYRSLDVQVRVFRSILHLCAEAGDKILSVHSVRSGSRVLDLVEECLPKGRSTVVLHWFTGTAKDVRRGVALGCYYSVNEQMLASPNGAARVGRDTRRPGVDGNGWTFREAGRQRYRAGGCAPSGRLDRRGSGEADGNSSTSNSGEPAFPDWLWCGVRAA